MKIGFFYCVIIKKRLLKELLTEHSLFLLRSSDYLLLVDATRREFFSSSIDSRGKEQAKEKENERINHFLSILFLSIEEK